MEPSSMMDEKHEYDIPRARSPSASIRSYGQSINGSTHGHGSWAGNGNFVYEIKHEIMANYLFQQQCTAAWIGAGVGVTEGVLVRKSRQNQHYIACPPDLIDSPLAQGAIALNLPAAMTINSSVIRTFLSASSQLKASVPLSNGMRVQILPTIHDLPSARKNHCAAIIAADGILLVWDDEPENLFTRGQTIEKALMNLVWSTHNEEELEVKANEARDLSEKKLTRVAVTEFEEESGEPIAAARPSHLLNTILVGITLCLVTIMLGAGWRALAVEVAVDHNYLRLALVLLTPVQVFFTLFFAQVVVGCLAQMLGPINQVKENSKYYSAVLPARIGASGRPLPHVTIQCPVYKEGLEGVIMPTVKSIKAAISTYEMQGGTANIFINDDGLQLIDEEERQARIDFYADHSIGWTARPKHGDNFVRKGKFKKASNMNYGLMISNKVEEKLAMVNRTEGWSQLHESVEYGRCLREVCEELDGRAWADGNIRMGDYILIIDSDTRVPVDCLLDAVSEMEQYQEVAIMQFASGVMQVVHDYFENGITFFTNLIYSAIKYTVSNGDVAPFVGHNAILRWAAIQQIGYFDEDGYEKFWSEAHVSEDFEMSLKLQCAGYTIRLASWDQGGFKEGVSLTVYDELARWEKYAYGCNELLFHPLRTWLWRGPFTPLFRKFLFSNIRFTSKITVISYIGTYYAIGAAWILTLVNYVAIGFFNGYLDKYYIDSWKVWFSIIIVFSGLGNVSLAVMRYRIGEKGFLSALIENFKWTLMFAIFLGGLSLHVSQALLSHMFEINMTWGATAKEVEFSNFFIEVPKVLKNFKYSMAASLIGIAAMIILAVGPFVPYDWRVTDFIAILPMSTVCVSHFLLPLALNPALMTFTF